MLPLAWQESDKGTVVAVGLEGSLRLEQSEEGGSRLQSQRTALGWQWFHEAYVAV